MVKYNICVKELICMAVSQTVLSAVFSDESPIYRFPSEPDPGDSVKIRMRVAKDSAKRVLTIKKKDVWHSRIISSCDFAVVYAITNIIYKVADYKL